MKKTFFYILLLIFVCGVQNIVAQNNEPKTKRIEIVYGGEFTIDNAK